MAESLSLASDGVAAERAGTVRLRILSLNIGHAFAHLFMLIYPTVVLTLEAQAGGRYGDLLLPSTVGFVAFAAGTLPAGWLGDRWSRQSMMTLMFFGLGLGGLVTGLADSALGFSVGLGIIGLFAAIYHPVGISLLVEQARPLGRQLGINGVFGNMGVAAAPLIAAGLSTAMGWRWAFFLPAALAVAIGIAMLFLPQPARGEQAKREVPDAAPPRAVLIRVLLFLLASAFLGGVVFNATTISLPKLLDDQMRDVISGPLGSGGLAAVIFAAAAFAQILVGFLIDRYPLKPLAMIMPLLQVPVLILVVSLTGWAAFPAALAVMLLVFGEIPITDTLVARYSASAWRARFYAVKYVVALGVGALAVPLVALLHDPGAGFYDLYLLLAGMMLVLGICALVLPKASAPARA